MRNTRVVFFFMDYINSMTLIIISKVAKFLKVNLRYNDLSKEYVKLAVTIRVHLEK